MQHLRTFDLNAPATISRLFVALGGRYTIGAMRLCDSPAAMMKYRAAGQESERHPSFAIGAALEVIYSDGVEFPVRGPIADSAWNVVVAAEPDGTATVWLTTGRDAGRRLVTCKRGPVDDSLRLAVVNLWRKSLRATGV